ncbi:MAG: hypothetical protein Q9205_004244 [Flavoplaca limonia]
MMINDPGTIFGGIYPKDAAHTFGIGCQIPPGFTPAMLETVKRAFFQWDEQEGGVVDFIQRANDFYNLAEIGAGEKLRRGTKAAQQAYSEFVLPH